MGLELSYVFRFTALVDALRTRQTHGVFAWFARHLPTYSTEDWKICSPFPEQFDVFYQREVKEKENRTGPSGEFLNGCPM